VRHEHIASLGSLEIPQTIPGRLTLWQRLYERLARLANRLNAEAQAKVLAAVHGRVPMVTADEQRALQLENAKADADFWERLHSTQTGTVEDHKGLAAAVAANIAQGETAAAEAAVNAKAARERVERIERGENVEGGLHKRWTRETIEAELIKSGDVTREDLRHWERVAELHKIIGEAGGDKVTRTPLLCLLSIINFVRVHKTLRMTPAMAAGVTKRLWEISDVVDVLEAWEAFIPAD